MRRVKQEQIKIPRYRYFAPRNCACVQFGCRRIYITGAPYGSEQSRAQYNQLVSAWIAGGRKAPPQLDASGTPVKKPSTFLTIGTIAARYAKHLRNTRPTPDGRFHNYFNVVGALREFRDTYCHRDARELRADDIERMQIIMAKRRLSRRTIVERIYIIRNSLVHAVKVGLLPEASYFRWKFVELIRTDHPKLKPRKRVLPVDEATVQRTCEKLTPTISDLVKLLLLCGARIGEIAQMRVCDIDVTNDAVWIFRPERHKTEHHGHTRTIAFGPRAIAIISPRLAGRKTTDFVFSPVDSHAEFLAARHEARKTKEGYGNCIGTNLKPHPSWKPGASFMAGTVCRAIKKACARAGVPMWTTHALRHTAATRLRKKYGLELASRQQICHETARHGHSRVGRSFQEKHERSGDQVLGF